MQDRQRIHSIATYSYANMQRKICGMAGDRNAPANVVHECTWIARAARISPVRRRGWSNWRRLVIDADERLREILFSLLARSLAANCFAHRKEASSAWENRRVKLYPGLLISAIPKYRPYYRPYFLSLGIADIFVAVYRRYFFNAK